LEGQGCGCPTLRSDKVRDVAIDIVRTHPEDAIISQQVAPVGREAERSGQRRGGSPIGQINRAVPPVKRPRGWSPDPPSPIGSAMLPSTSSGPTPETLAFPSELLRPAERPREASEAKGALIPSAKRPGGVGVKSILFASAKGPREAFNMSSLLLPRHHRRRPAMPQTRRKRRHCCRFPPCLRRDCFVEPSHQTRCQAP
jgi:hypothetical protein